MLTKKVMEIKLLALVIFLQINKYVRAEIRDSVVANKLFKVKPVGSNVARNFIPLTEIPPPNTPHYHADDPSGRRHLDDCVPKPEPKEISGGGKAEIFGEYYDEGVAKTVATVIIPDHIDNDANSCTGSNTASYSTPKWHDHGATTGTPDSIDDEKRRDQGSTVGPPDFIENAKWPGHSVTPHLRAQDPDYYRIESNEWPKPGMFEEYYDEGLSKTVASSIVTIPYDKLRVNIKHFEVTTQVPYLTVGPIEAMGYHPSTMKSEHPSECEKIYQDHLAEQYSDESMDYSEESLEMARMPLAPIEEIPASFEAQLEKMYDDMK